MVKKSCLHKARNPASGVEDYQFEGFNPAALNEIAMQMRRGQKVWSTHSVQQRVEVLKHFAEQLKQREPQLIGALSADTGRVALSRTEVAGIYQKIARDSAAAVRHVEQYLSETDRAGSLTARRLAEPYQLVGNITPWNFPVSLSFLDTFQALLMGSAVLVKPSEITPRFVDPVSAAIMATPLLRDVFKFVRGGGDIGAALIDCVDYVCFTGSVVTGKKVYATAGKRFIPASMELGGKDPAIVLDDVDIERAAASVLLGATIASGQICTSIERVYVARSVYTDYMDATAALAKKAEPTFTSENALLTPFIHAPQADVFLSHIEEAKAQGATVLAGGDLIRHGGLWPTATVLGDVSHDMQVMREETFAPIVPVMPFDDDEESIHLANDSDYGLSAVVYGRDLERASRVASRIRCGAASINMSRAHIRMRKFEQEPYGVSGIGKSRIGADGLLRFCRKRCVIEGGFDDMAEAEETQIDTAFGS